MAERYRAWIAWMGARPAAVGALRAAARVAVALVYALYLGLLAWLACTGDARLWRAALVPAAVFAGGTLLRRVIDRPRPYEVLGFAPLLPKETKGQSMPSRHCFCAAAIAVAAWYCWPPLGGAAAVLALLVGLSRVAGGVHWPGDVLAGWALGAGAALLGFFCF